MKPDWRQLLEPVINSDSFRELWSFVEAEYRTKNIYPAKDQIFTALELTGYKETKVVILGQDPYHGEKQAHGLSFSVAHPEAKFPPSLRNIFKELQSDLQQERTQRNLSDWAEQGVLLLNTVLTVEAGKAASHRGKGWEHFTDAIIRELNNRESPVVFLLWGADAQKKLKLITEAHHVILKSAHPSPLSAYNGFFGSKPFSAVNNALREMGKSEIIWQENHGL